LKNNAPRAAIPIANIRSYISPTSFAPFTAPLAELNVVGEAELAVELEVEVEFARTPEVVVELEELVAFVPVSISKNVPPIDAPRPMRLRNAVSYSVH
jgi:hypothetical protein